MKIWNSLEKHRCCWRHQPLWAHTPGLSTWKCYKNMFYSLNCITLQCINFCFWRPEIAIFSLGTFSKTKLFIFGIMKSRLKCVLVINPHPPPIANTLFVYDVNEDSFHLIESWITSSLFSFLSLDFVLSFGVGYDNVCYIRPKQWGSSISRHHLCFVLQHPLNQALP